MIYGHGNNLLQYKKGVIDFSSNVVSYIQETNSAIRDAVAKSIINIHNYPEPNAKPLQETLERFHNLQNRRALVTNGSTESFYLIAQLFKGGNSAIVTPSFSEYNDACVAHNHKITDLSQDSILDIDLTPFDTVWIGNPNNPNGVITDIIGIIERYPDTMFIVDEAYADLCPIYQSYVNRDYKNLIVTKSLTKTFAIPGLRVGYAVVSLDIYNSLLEIKQPWSVNSIAIDIGCYIVNNYSELKPDVEKIVDSCIELQRRVNSIDGLKVTATECNYFLIESSPNIKSDGEVTPLFKYLIDNHNILVRDCANFHGLDDRFIRIAVSSSINNIKLEKALIEWSLQR